MDRENEVKTMAPGFITCSCSCCNVRPLVRLCKSGQESRCTIKIIAIAEPIPTVDLNLPKPVVLASLYHSVDEALDVLNDVLSIY